MKLGGLLSDFDKSLEALDLAQIEVEMPFEDQDTLLVDIEVAASNRDSNFHIRLKALQYFEKLSVATLVT